MRAAQLEPFLRPFENKRSVLIHDQSVGDIMQGILSTHDRYKSEYDKICMHFNAATPYQIGYKIWQFLKDNVRYKVEPDSRQMLKSPSAIIAPGTSSDCKNYSLFTGGVLAALGRKGMQIPFCYRFSSYRITERTPQHVFVVMYPNTNHEIWCDAVLSRYNDHKSYYYKIDKTPNMSLIALAGVDEMFSIGKKGDKRRKFFQKLKNDIKKAGKFVLRYGAAVPRNSFLEMVKLNVRSLATNLKKVNDKDPGKVRKFWENLGGNYSRLNKQIEHGAKQRRLGAADDAAMIGMDPATLSALIAAGATIAAVAIKQLGIGGKDDEKALSDAVNTTTANTLSDINKEAEGQETPSGDKIVKAQGGNMKILAIVGGAAVVGYFLLKKK